MLANREFRERFVDSVGFEAYGLPHEEFGKLIETNRAKYQALLKRLNLQAN